MDASSRSGGLRGSDISRARSIDQPLLPAEIPASALARVSVRGPPDGLLKQAVRSQPPTITAPYPDSYVGDEGLDCVHPLFDGQEFDPCARFDHLDGEPHYSSVPSHTAPNGQRAGLGADLSRSSVHYRGTTGAGGPFFNPHAAQHIAGPDDVNGEYVFPLPKEFFFPLRDQGPAAIGQARVACEVVNSNTGPDGMRI
jgi:hypothetical protein